MNTAQAAICNLVEEYLAGHRDFERIDLRERSLSALHLADARFCWADMTNSSLEQINLDRADLTGAMMWRADISHASLLWANLHQAVMVRCKAVGANLSGANLHRTDLRLANLQSACLAGADLRGAKLCYSDLRKANLTGADLTGADLTGAKLIGACLDSVCWRAAVLSPDKSADLETVSPAAAHNRKRSEVDDEQTSEQASAYQLEEVPTGKRSLSAV